MSDALEQVKAAPQRFRAAVNEGKQSWTKRAVAPVLAVLGASFAIQYLQRYGAQALLDQGVPTILGTLILAAIVLRVVQLVVYGASPIVALLIVNIAIAVLLVRLIGTPSLVVDLAILVAAVAAAVAATRWKRVVGDKAPHPGEVLRGIGAAIRWPFLVSAAFWTVIWAASGVVDFVRERAPFDRKAPAAWKRTVANAYRDSSIRIGLALSGGGYRAALLHAGVLSMFDREGIPVRVMSTVSGGSIIGAYYAMGGSPDDFLKATIERRFNLERRLVRPSNVLRMLASTRWFDSDFFILPTGEFNRSSVQAGLLDQVLFKGVPHRYSASPRDSTADIQLMLCMTDIVGGIMVGVTPFGFVEHHVSPPATRFAFMSTESSTPFNHFHVEGQSALPGTSRLARLVAASGAFPGAFKPFRVSLHQPRSGSDSAKVDTTQFVLADGGMADNLGLVLLYSARQYVRKNAAEFANLDTASRRALGNWDVNLVVASDGSAISAPHVPRWGLEEISNAIDVVSRASAGEHLTGPDTNPPTVLLSPDRFLDLGDPESMASLRMFEPGGSDTTVRVGTGAASRFRRPTFMTLTPADLRFLVEGMDSAITVGAYVAPRKAVMAWIDTIQKRTLGRHQTDSRLRTDSQSWADSLVYLAVRADFEELLRAFLETPTLSSNFTEEQATSLFRLGQYLFLLNRPYFEYAVRNVRRPGVPRVTNLVTQAGRARATYDAVVRQHIRPMQWKK